MLQRGAALKGHGKLLDGKVEREGEAAKSFFVFENHRMLRLSSKLRKHMDSLYPPGSKEYVEERMRAEGLVKVAEPVSEEQKAEEPKVGTSDGKKDRWEWGGGRRM